MRVKHTHDFRRYELTTWCAHFDGTVHEAPYFVGYRCACGEEGYALP